MQTRVRTATFTKRVQSMTHTGICLLAEGMFAMSRGRVKTTA